MLTPFRGDFKLSPRLIRVPTVEVDHRGRSAHEPRPSAHRERSAITAVAQFLGAAFAIVDWHGLIKVELWNLDE
jgi:hypothetical protein